MCFMFILVYLGMNVGCDRIGHFFFAVRIHYYCLYIGVYCSGRQRGSSSFMCGGSNSSGDPVGGIIYAYTAYVKGD